MARLQRINENPAPAFLKFPAWVRQRANAHAT